MRYILAFVPSDENINTYRQASQKLFSKVQEGYLLLENIIPHITICQFQCEVPKMETIWNQIEELKIPSLIPRFVGVGFVKGEGVHESYYWAQIIVARDERIMKPHLAVVKILRSQHLICLNDSEDLYNPHLTLARIRLPDIIERWSDNLTDNPSSFKMVIGEGDDNGQLLKILFQSDLVTPVI